MIKKFIETVRTEKDGFKFDQPWRLEDKSLGVIVPILKWTEKKRTYITLAEAQQVKVEDTGQIDYVFIKNDEDKPLYISRGDIFRGKTQERAAVHGHIIMPGKSLRVAVRCIHQSKGINSGTDMKYGGKTPISVDLSSQHSAWDTIREYHQEVHHSHHYEPCYRPYYPHPWIWPMANAECDNTISSHSEWLSNATTMAHDTSQYKSAGSYTANDNAGNSVYLSCANVGDDFSFPADDDLISTLDNLSDFVKTAAKKIPHIDNQVGALFLVENDIVGVDIYDLPESWEAVKQEIVAKESANYLKKDDHNIFEFKPEKIKALIEQKFPTDLEEKIIYDREYKIVELKNKKFGGEATIFKNSVIQLTLWKLTK